MFSERGSRLTRARSAAQHFETSACNSRIFCKVLGRLPLGKLWALSLLEVMSFVEWPQVMSPGEWSKRQGLVR